jgi:hypothetical protein
VAARADDLGPRRDERVIDGGFEFGDVIRMVGAEAELGGGVVVGRLREVDGAV